MASIIIIVTRQKKYILRTSTDLYSYMMGFVRYRIPRRYNNSDSKTTHTMVQQINALQIEEHRSLRTKNLGAKLPSDCENLKKKCELVQEACRTIVTVVYLLPGAG